MRSISYVKESGLLPLPLTDPVSSRISRRLSATLVLCLWLISLVPPLMGILENGRALNLYGAVADVQSPLGASVRFFLQIAIIGVATAIFFFSYARGRFPDPISVVIVSLPGLAVLLFGIQSSGANFRWQALLVLFFLAASLVVPPSPLLLARLTLLTAASAVALGLLGPGLMPSAWHEGDDKAIFSSILAGPFSQPNALALIVCLGLPFVLLVYRGFALFFAWVLLLFVELWSSSRTSLAAFLATSLVFFLIFRVRSRALVVFLGTAALVAASAIVITLPIITTDPLAFTGRGRIWQAILTGSSESPVFGFGPYVLLEPSVITSMIGFIPYHGHNLTMSLLATGGWLAVGSAVILIAVSWTRAVIRRRERFVVLFLLAVLASGALEDTLRLEDVSEVSWLAWSIIAIVVVQPVLLNRPSARVPRVQRAGP